MIDNIYQAGLALMGGLLWPVVWSLIKIVVVIAPLIGCFAFSPLAVAWGIQPYPLAAALSVMAAEALTITGLVFFVRNTKR